MSNYSGKFHNSINAIVASRPAKYKATGSLCDPRGKGRGTKLSIRHFNAIDEAMEANDELSALELQKYSKSDFTLQYLPKLFGECGGNLEEGGTVQSTANLLKT